MLTISVMKPGVGGFVVPDANTGLLNLCVAGQ